MDTVEKSCQFHILSAIKSPQKVAVTQSNTLARTYRIKLALCPCWKSVRVSLLKAEKVLKPPQKPTVQNNFVAGERSCLWSASPIKKPKAKQAIILTTKVPNGKWKLCKLLIHFPSPNLVRLPSPPPINIAISSFIYCCQFDVARSSLCLPITVCSLPKVVILPLNFIRRAALQIYKKLSYEAPNHRFWQGAVTSWRSVCRGREVLACRVLCCQLSVCFGVGCALRF